MGLTPPPPWRIGLTGGIGAGKSTVSAMLAELGATIIDSDAIAHQLTQPGGAAMPDIEAAFGAAAVQADGAMNRPYMRARVFEHPVDKQRLEGILHPLIALETERQAQRSDAPVLVFDVPLLVESGRWRARVHEIWVVDASEATQQRRVTARSGWTAERTQQVMAQQATRAQRLAVADRVFDNDQDDLPGLKRQVLSAWQALKI